MKVINNKTKNVIAINLNENQAKKIVRALRQVTGKEYLVNP